MSEQQFSDLLRECEVPAKVDILMATYQGESWADVQIATIVAQNYRDWRLLIRDDGSTDRTRDIIRNWRDRLPEKIFILDESSTQNLGVTGNFTALLNASSADYIMFSSWDDVWYRDKVSSAVGAMQSMQYRYGTDRPLLIHTDLRIVDSDLHQLYPSLFKLLGCVSGRKLTLGRFCLENPAFGCAMIANRALVKLAKPIPAAARCEDWWFALVAAAFGNIETRHEISLDWRRHGLNDSYDLPSLVGSLQSLLINPMAHRRKLLENLTVNRQVIASFLARFEAFLSEEDRRCAQAFIELPALGFWARRRAIIRNRIFYGAKARTIGLLMLA